jgi:hypothetical protein
MSPADIAEWRYHRLQLERAVDAAMKAVERFCEIPALAHDTTERLDACENACEEIKRALRRGLLYRGRGIKGGAR